MKLNSLEYRQDNDVKARRCCNVNFWTEIRLPIYTIVTTSGTQRNNVGLALSDIVTKQQLNANVVTKTCVSWEVIEIRYLQKWKT